jgi:hypothetical protein
MRLSQFELGVVLSVTWGLNFICVVTLALSVEHILCRGRVNTGKIVVLSVMGVCFLVLETVGAGAARSAKFMRPILDWAVVWQF